ncbi:MAG: ABC transporter substrate-binding protein, partial [Hyphomicrobiaceae bacterium]|nr:ABC transporter substrate-binding protein [Hyphomicrobiaceae bacterium]
APIDAVFLPGGQDVLPQLGPLLTYSGFDAGKVKLLGSGAWEFATLGSNAAFVGGWYPGPDPAGWRTFQAKFTKSFGQAPPRVASIAYDAMQLAMSLSAEAPGQRFTAANLTRPGGFNGVDGTFRLSPDGHVERSLAILEVQKIGSQVIEPAAEVGRSLDGARLSGTPPRVN